MTLFATDPRDPAARQRLFRAKRAGELRRLHAGVYTDDLTSSPEQIVRRELYPLLAIVTPGAILTHRSALESSVSSASALTLTGPYTRAIKLPGLTLRVRKGPGPRPDDIGIPTPFGTTWRSSPARALLENLEESRGAPESRRSLGQAAVEQKLEQLLALHGPDALNQTRDRARDIAGELGLDRENARLDGIIGTLLGTRRLELKHPVAIARGRGEPYDPIRVDLFQALAERLEARPPVIPAARTTDDERYRAFIEAYFSNYIEGTEFALEEAEAVVLENQQIEYRDDDSHDVRGTFHAILESKNRPFPATVEAFKDQLVAWNRQVIFSRASKRPGEWKTVANRAGDTPFAAPELVQGTLTKGFETICAASTPAIKAALAMFVVAEVHPFADGNGRTARLAMNLVLSAEGLVRIIVPTVYRDDYWSALHALSHSTPDEKPYPRTDAYVSMLSRAAAFSAWLDSSSLERMRAQLKSSNATLRATQAKLQFP